MQVLKTIYTLIKETVENFGEDKAFRHGAAISYFTVFSLPAIIIIIISLIGGIFGEAQVRLEILGQVESLVGADVANELNSIINAIDRDTTSVWTTIIGIGTLLFGATGTFYHLQDSLNTIWKIDVKPTGGGGILKLIVDRVLSFTMVVTLGFILLVSMVLKTLIVALNRLIEVYFDQFSELLLRFSPDSWIFLSNFDLVFAVTYAIDVFVSLGIITLIFGLMFRFLPDARVKWKDIWLGAFLTAILFVIGEFAIGWYISNSRVTTTYGAAGSIVVILLWVFYSAQILLLGAEFIYVYTQFRGRPIQPTRIAQRLADRPIRRLMLSWKRYKKRKARKLARAAQKTQVNAPDVKEEEHAPEPSNTAK
ncbi:MAG: YihY/virulence factor BrkB family protein [Bacteroidota bacterium]